MKTKLIKLSLFAALSAVPLGLQAELPGWPTPDFLEVQASLQGQDVPAVYPVFVKPNGSGSGASWASAASLGTLVSDPVIWAESPYYQDDETPLFVQLILAAGRYGPPETDPKIEISIPDQISVQLPNDDIVTAYVVAVRGGYYELPGKVCANGLPSLQRYDTREVANPILGQNPTSGDQEKSPEQKIAEVLGLSGAAALNSAVISPSSVDWDDQCAKASVFDAVYWDGGAGEFVPLLNTLKVEDGAFLYGILFDNIVVVRGSAELPLLDNFKGNVYGGGLFVEAEESFHKTVHLHGMTFFNNYAVDRGGAVYIEGRDPDSNNLSRVHMVVSYSAFLENEAQIEGGGALWNDGISLKVMQTVFEGNTSSQGQGGAVYTTPSLNKDYAGFSFDPDGDVGFLQYPLPSGGGYPYFPWPETSTLVLAQYDSRGVYFVSNVFFGNSSGQQGGAGYAANESESAWINNTFVSNHAQVDGGALNFAPQARLLEIATRSSYALYAPFLTNTSELGFYNNLFVSNTESNDFLQIGQIRHDGSAFDTFADANDAEDLPAYLLDDTDPPFGAKEYAQNNWIIPVAEGVAADGVLRCYTHQNDTNRTKRWSRAAFARGEDGALGTDDDGIALADGSPAIDSGDLDILKDLSHGPRVVADGFEGFSGAFYRYDFANQIGITASADEPASWHRDYMWGYADWAIGIIDTYYFNNFDDERLSDVSNFLGFGDITVTGTYNVFWRYGLDVVTKIPGRTQVIDITDDDDECSITSVFEAYSGSWYEQGMSFRVRDGDNNGTPIVDVGAYEFRAGDSYFVEVQDPRVIYVDDNAPGDENGVHDGNSWRSAYLFLQDAILRAQLDPMVEVIRVAQGENEWRNYTNGNPAKPVWQITKADLDSVHYNPGRPSALHVRVGDAEWNVEEIAEEIGQSATEAQVMAAAAATGVQIPFALDARTSQVLTTSGNSCISESICSPFNATVPARCTNYPFPSYFAMDRYEEYRHGEVVVSGDLFSDGDLEIYIEDSNDSAIYDFQTYLRARGPWDPDKYMRNLIKFRFDQDIVVYSDMMQNILVAFEPVDYADLKAQLEDLIANGPPENGIDTALAGDIDYAIRYYLTQYANYFLQGLEDNFFNSYFNPIVGYPGLALGMLAAVEGAGEGYLNYDFPFNCDDEGAVADAILAALRWSEHPEYRYNLTQIVEANSRDLWIYGGYRGWRIDPAITANLDNDPAVVIPWEIDTMVDEIPDPDPNQPCAFVRYPQADDSALNGWLCVDSVYMPGTCADSPTVEVVVIGGSGDLNESCVGPYTRTRMGTPGNTYDYVTVTTGYINPTLVGPIDYAVGSPRNWEYSKQLFLVGGVGPAFDPVKLDGLTIQDAGAVDYSGISYTELGLVEDGAGIASYQTGLSIRYVTVQDNKSNDEGGGIYSDGDDRYGVEFDLANELYIWNSVVENNSSGNIGGGIHVDESTFYMWNSHVLSNVTYDRGGGIFIDDTDADIRNSIINFNSAGASYLFNFDSCLVGGSLEMRRNLDSVGGGINIEANSNVYVDYMASDLASLRSDYDRFNIDYLVPSADAWALVYCYDLCGLSGEVMPEGCHTLIHANSAAEAGGGIYVEPHDNDALDVGTRLSLNNTTVQYNEASNDRYGSAPEDVDPDGSYSSSFGGGLAVDGRYGAIYDNWPVEGLPQIWLHNTNFIANKADYGAGAYIRSPRAFEVDTSIFLANWAKWGGGGIAMGGRIPNEVLTDERDRRYWINQSLIVGNRAAPEFGIWDDIDRPYAGGIYSLNAPAWIQHSVIAGNMAPYGPAWVDDIDIVTFNDFIDDNRGGRNPNFAPYVARMLVFNSIIDDNVWYNRPGSAFDEIKQIGGYVLLVDDEMPGPGNTGSVYTAADPRDRISSNPELGILWSLISDPFGFYNGDTELGDTIIVGQPQFDDDTMLAGPRGFYYLDYFNPALADATDLDSLAGKFIEIILGKTDEDVAYDEDVENFTDCPKFGDADDMLGFRVTGGLGQNGSFDYWGNMARHMGVYADSGNQQDLEPFNQALRVFETVYIQNDEDWYYSNALMDFVLIRADNMGWVYSDMYGWMQIVDETGPDAFWVYTLAGGYFWLNAEWGPDYAYSASNQTWGPLPSIK